MSSEIHALYLAAVKTLAAQVTRNEYGDLASTPAGARFVTGHGKHTRLPGCLRATQIDGWGKYGPSKSTGYVVTAEVLALYDAAVAADVARKKAAKKLAEQAAAKAAGHATFEAWKRAEKERLAREEQAAAELAAKARAEREQRTLARMAALGLAPDLDDAAVGVLDVLEAAVADGHQFDRAEIRAVVYAMSHESAAWLAYQEGEMSAADLLHRCERAQHRHENTNYDELLRAGYDREDARDYATAY